MPLPAEATDLHFVVTSEGDGTLSVLGSFTVADKAVKFVAQRSAEGPIVGTLTVHEVTPDNPPPEGMVRAVAAAQWLEEREAPVAKQKAEPKARLEAREGLFGAGAPKKK